MSITQHNNKNIHVGLFGCNFSSGFAVRNLRVEGKIDLKNITGIYDGGSVYAGGIVGYTRAQAIENCQSDVSISIELNSGNFRKVVCGGVVGHIEISDMTCKNCYSKGKIDVNLNNSNEAKVGGIFGNISSNDVIVSCCASDCNIKVSNGRSSDVGGIVGGANCKQIDNSHFSGAIELEYPNYGLAGGIVGMNFDCNLFSSCLMTGQIRNTYGTGWVSAISGTQSNTIVANNCYYLSGIPNATPYGKALIESELKSGNPLVGFDESIWLFKQGQFPILKFLSKETEQVGHEYVDLGLPSGRLWAKTNYGSEKEDDYGEYVEWPNRNIICSTWGEDWKVPSIYDFYELANYCTYNWVYSINNVYGVEFTGPNGNKLFIPAAGMSTWGTPNNIGNVAFYWSDTEASNNFACVLTCYSENKSVNANESLNYSIGALPIRPVLSSHKQPYAVLSDNNTVLTFYYDTQKVVRKGMSVGPIIYDDAHYKPLSEWYDYSSSIKKVIFDESFSDYHDITSTAYWFESCNNLEEINGLANLNTENVTTMKRMFIWCSNLKTLDLSNFNTENVMDMSHMFQQCSSLKELHLDNFDTKNVTTMHQMFDGCTGLNYLDLSGFDTRNVTDMGFMFNNCYELETLDLSNFNTENVTVMGIMFDTCTKLKTIYASHDWNTGKVSENEFVFYRCYSLVGGQGTKWVDGNIYPIYARIDRGVEAPGYFTYKSSGISDHEYVNLGLPSGTLWATMNVGAERIEDVGNYYSWGETEVKWPYSLYNYTFYDGHQYTKYCTAYKYGIPDGKTELDMEDDAAAMRFGSSWRIPSDTQISELIKNCSVSKSSVNGVDGYLFTGPNGNSIFFPITGGCKQGSDYNTNCEAFYWARNLHYTEDGFAYLFTMNNGVARLGFGDRYVGCAIRAVYNKDASGISTPTLTIKHGQSIYDMNGRKLTQQKKGINIIRDENGNVKKLFVK